MYSQLENEHHLAKTNNVNSTPSRRSSNQFDGVLTKYTVTRERRPRSRVDKPYTMYKSRPRKVIERQTRANGRIRNRGRHFVFYRLSRPSQFPTPTLSANRRSPPLFRLYSDFGNYLFISNRRSTLSIQ